MNADGFQRAVFSKLSGSVSILVALSTKWGTTPIFADVPEVDGDSSAYFPFVTFGKDTFVPWDTKSTHGGNVTFQVDIWTRSANYTQAKAIAGLVYDVLHDQELTITGSASILTRNESAAFSMDPDGITRRGLMLFRAQYDNA